MASPAHRMAPRSRESVARGIQRRANECEGLGGEIHSVTVSLPLPSQLLGKNGRAGWRGRHTAFQDAKTSAYALFRNANPGIDLDWAGPVRASARWFAARGPMPDRDNAIMRMAAYADGAESAHVFLDDKQIINWHVEFARDVHAPRVELTFEEVMQ